MRYISIFDLVRELMDEEALASGKLRSKYFKPDLLIIDDMGLKQLPARAGEHLFEVIMRRYELRFTLMTSNRPIEDRGHLIGDVPAAGRASTGSFRAPRSSPSKDAATGCVMKRKTNRKPRLTIRRKKATYEASQVVHFEPPIGGTF